ncbi:MAG: LuxR C-terminal-related transcriptional regulator [Thermoleophilaceae bacterium]
MFQAAFRGSRNAMALVNDRRVNVDANGALLKLLGYRREDLVGRSIWEFVVGGPLATDQEWDAALAERRFTGHADLRTAGGDVVSVQYGAHVETVTGLRLVLFVVLSSSRVGGTFRREPTPSTPAGELTAREIEIVRLTAEGLTAPEIAEDLGISNHTVRTHARNAMAKLGARSRAHLVAIALGGGHALG